MEWWSGRPVWVEHCILTALVKASCLVVVDGPCDGCLSVSYVCMYTHYNNYYFVGCYVANKILIKRLREGQG